MKRFKLSLLCSTLMLSSLVISPISYANTATVVTPAINQQLIDGNGIVERDGNLLMISWQGMPMTGEASINWLDVASGKSQPLKVTIKAGKAKFIDPNPNRRTIFKLPAGKVTVSLAERKVPALGMDNLRDLGGLKTTDGRYTKWGLAYRADTLYKAKAEGYRYLTSMNMGYVFDLRNEGEFAKKPDPAMDGVTYFHTQILDNPPQYADVSWDDDEKIYQFVSTPRAEDFYIDTNIFMVEAKKNHQSLKHVFDVALKGDGKGMVWHCAGGKDRTGYVSALFLAALGVPQETIVNEYLLTNEYRKEFDKQELVDMNQVLKNDPKAIKGFIAIQQSRPEYIQAGLKRIEQQYGSINNYLEKEIGVTQAQIEQLKQLYTE